MCSTVYNGYPAITGVLKRNKQEGESQRRQGGWGDVWPQGQGCRHLK